MIKRLAAILFIFTCTTIAWMILAGTIQYRTTSADSGLRGRVVSTWGAPHEQRPPSASYDVDAIRTVESVQDGQKIERTEHVKVAHSLPLESSHIEVRLQLEPRQKGLLWFS